MYFLKTWTWCWMLIFREVMLTSSFLFSLSPVQNKVSLDFLINISKCFPTFSLPRFWRRRVSVIGYFVIHVSLHLYLFLLQLSKLCELCITWHFRHVKAGTEVYLHMTVVFCTKEEFFTVSSLNKNLFVSNQRILSFWDREWLS